MSESEIVSGVLKLTLGFLLNKARSEILERLNDGDVTDEERRRLIVRELDDVKRKLGSLARKDLLSSLCFLEEGINGLYQSLQKFKATENGQESTEQTTLAGATSSEETVSVPQINEANQVITLVSAFNSLKIHSKERYESAIESFKLAREKATEAFSNEALSIEDRTQASQVRMMARILEKPEDPDAGVSDCLQYLKQLHDIKAIQDRFSVVIGSSIQFLSVKTKLLSHSSSVHQMNLLLFEFSRRFTNLRTVFFDWPRILLGNKTHHPLVRDRLIEIYEESGVEITSPYPDFTFPDRIDQSYCVVVNSKREIVAKMVNKSLQVLKPSGESRTIFDPSKQEDARYCQVVAMDIDDEDNLYVVTRFQESRGQPWSFKLLIFDEHGNTKPESLLPFQSIQSRSASYVRMAVNNDNDKKIAVLDPEKKILHLGTSRQTNSFEVGNSFRLEIFIHYVISAIRFLDNNGTKIIVAGYCKDCFYIYTENGELERKVMIPEVWQFVGIPSVAINYITKRILVKSHQQEIYLSSFSETGELTDNIYLGSKWKNELYNAKVISNPHGAVALVGTRRVFFLQL